MRLPAIINAHNDAVSRNPAVPIIVGKLFLWIALTLVFFSFLFRHITGQFSALLFNTLNFNLGFLPWIVLLVCLSALFLSRHSVWEAMRTYSANYKDAASALVQSFLGLDIILTALLVLLAYPLPPAPEFLVFRWLTAVLAGFVLVFGRKAALVPSLVIGTYGLSIVFFSVIAALMA